MKRAWTCLGLAAWAAVGWGAPTAQRNPDQLFEKKLYQEALTEYQSLIKTASGEDLDRAQFRIAECETLLFRYGEALQFVSDWKMPQDALWKARYLILKTELYREFVKQYGFAARGDVVEGEPDTTRKTPKEMHAAIRDGYEALWDLRKTLAARPLENERDFVDLENVRPEEYPTLWDFVVLRWTEYLLEEAPADLAPKPAAIQLARDEYSVDPDKRDPKEPSLAKQAAFLMEAAAREPFSARAESVEWWKLRRLLLPFNHSDKFHAAGDWKPERAQAIATLKGWMESFRTDEPRAEAGYTAASFHHQGDAPDPALELCRQVEERWPRSMGSQKCRRLRGQILMPELSLSEELGSDGQIPSVGTRNLKEVRFRLYKTSPEELAELRRDYYGRRREHGEWSWSRDLNTADKEAVEYFLRGKTLFKEWSTAVKLEKPSDIYRSRSQKIALPEMGLGIYLLVASDSAEFRPGDSLIAQIFLNKTGLVLVGTTGFEARERDMIYVPPDGRGLAPPAGRSRQAPAFHFYALDAHSGRPVPDASIDVQFGVNGRREDRQLETGKDGMAQLPVVVQLSPNVGNNYSADPLARRGESSAFWQNAAWLGYSVPQPFQLFVDTDRPIYRPGQKVGFKVTVVARHPEGFKSYRGEAKIAVRATDPNGQEVYKADLSVDPMGSVAAGFSIPTGRLLGRYSVSASIADWGVAASGYGSFQVEEYKRPEFEVTLEDAKGPWRFDRPAEVQGAVRYYFGGPVPNAPVTAKIYREAYIPWFCWWWFWRPRAGREEVKKIDAKTDAKGCFTFDFTPEAADPREPDPMPARFSFEVEARDPGGRTISGSKTYVAGKNAFLFNVEPPAGFLTAGKTADISVKLMNLSEQPVKGEASYEIHAVTAAPVNQDSPGWWGSFPESSSLDQIYKDAADGPKVAQGSFRTDGKKPGIVAAPGLKPGAYRLTLKARDPWGGEVAQSVVLVAAAPSGKLPLKIASLTLPEHPEVQVGEKARILLGSADVPEAIFVEIWAGQFLMSRRLLPAGGIKVLEIPVTNEHRGGFTVRWFGVKDFRVRSGQAALRVPRKDKELAVRLHLDKVLRPGQKASWSLAVKDRGGKPVEGEVLIAMFDRSLEYYVKSAESWVKGLYPQRPAPGGGTSSFYAVYGNYIPVETGWVKKILELFQTAIREPQSPMLRLNKTRLYYGYGGRFGAMRAFEMGGFAGGAMQAEHMAAPMAAAAPAMAKATAQSGMSMDYILPGSPKKKEAGRADAGKLSGEPSGEAVAPRTNFAETAVFLPQLRLKAGRAIFSFKSPEQLTGWRVLGHVFTRDMKTGTFSEETVTRKDLMVQVEMPRFFREGDAGTLKAVVHNETDAARKVAVTLIVTKEGKPASEELGLKNLEQEVRVSSRAVASVAWSIQVPRGIAAYKIRAIVRSAQLSDAEEKELPILPSRQRLIESVTVALNGDASKVLSLKAFGASDPTREQESMNLQIDPQLALTVLNSIPFLVQYPHECTEQTLNRFVPVAIVNEFYKKYPALARAAAKIPKRSTITPAWDRSDPRRLMTLMETPWEEVSQGIKSAWPVIDLLDAREVARQKEDALAKLTEAQLPSGGFPWFPGGREDAYMTLYILSGLAEAQRYGVPVPENMVRRALGYVNNEIPKRLKPTEEDLSYVLYAAYVVTSFPKKFEEAKQGFTFAKAWVDYADKHSDAMTPYGKALAAYVYWRLGERARGEAYLDRVMDGAREDPMTGVYWTPEKNSWLWYNDSVETHAFFLRTLQTLRPKDPRIPGVVQWLLFNRKGAEWKSTKASAAAIYALLDFMKSRGALDRGDEYAVRWGEIVETAKVRPDDWLEKPLRWTRLGAEITPAFGAPKVEKKGPGFAFASLTWVYSTDRLPESSGPGLIELERHFYNRVKVPDASGNARDETGSRAEGGEYHLKPLKSGDTVHVGDQLEVQIKIRTRSQFEYVHLKDPKAAGLEAEELLSGWKWDQLGRYEEPRDSLTNFFISWLPHGEYILRYRLRPTTAGRYRAGAAVLQSMYAPEFSAHSDGFELSVVE